VIPFVFLARLNPLAVIPFICFFAVLSTGGDLAATNANVSTDFLLVLVALILLFMTIIEFLGPPPRPRRQLSHTGPAQRPAPTAHAPARAGRSDGGGAAVIVLAASSSIFSKTVLTSLVAGGILAACR